MSLSDRDRKLIIGALEEMESIAVQVVLATFESFVRWFVDQLPAIYSRVRDELRKIWASIKMAFA